jgi:integrase
MATPKKIPSGIEKRGDSWRVRINRNGVKRSATFDDLDKAIRWRQAKLVEVEGRIDVRKEQDAALAATTSLKSLLQRYLHEVSPLKKGHRKEVSRLKMWMSQPWADLPVTSIRRENIRGWRDAKILDGKSPSTIRNSMNLLSAVFRHARSEWDIDIENPCGGLKRPAQRKARNVPPNADLEKLLIEAAEQSGAPWLSTWIVVASWTALRASEIGKLQWRDIDFTDNFIHLDDTKNDDDRDVVMLEPARNALLSWRGTKTPAPHDWVFPAITNPSRSIGPDTPTTSFARLTSSVLADNPTVKRVTLHDLRHWACTRLAPLHRDALHLSKTTGHRDLRALAIYFNPDARENAASIRAKHAAELDGVVA